MEKYSKGNLGKKSVNTINIDIRNVMHDNLFWVIVRDLEFASQLNNSSHYGYLN